MAKKIVKVKKPKKKKKYNLKSRITSALRRIWFYGPERREAAKIAKARGTCAICKEYHDKLQIDHINPVVLVTHWDSWQGYIDRLFCSAENLRGICSACHQVVTTLSKEIRKANKKA
jgi:5-methylcytosine-specific restriction endonuclease McrA